MNHSTERTQDFEQRPRTRPHAALPHDEQGRKILSSDPELAPTQRCLMTSKDARF